MRELFTSLLLASCLVPLAAGGMKASSSLLEETAPHSFANINSDPLWSSAVKRIDSNLQAYQRLPALVAPDVLVAKTEPPTRINVSITGSTAGKGTPTGSVSDVSAAGLQTAKAVEWCAARYRSYDPSDNSYQPYGGGSRQICVAPVEASPQVANADISGEPDGNVRWCMERYSSYRIEDNSYQPFSGGRKQCLGPGTQSASNSLRSSASVFVVQ